MTQNKTLKIGAILLAAGQSRRMGQPKVALPWGERTVLGTILHALEKGGALLGLQEVIIVSGAARKEIEEILQNTQTNLILQSCFNPRYQEDEMLYSLQIGLQCLSRDCHAVLVALGDQPQIQPRTVQAILEAYQQSQAAIVIPSYQMHRGHPWLIDHQLINSMKALQPPQTIRDFFQAHADLIHYVVVDTPTILQDLDTPADYERYRPQ
ncbi:MAG: nucleotidyltransferase family protein [Anaerolineales bacterium]